MTEFTSLSSSGDAAAIIETAQRAAEPASFPIEPGEVKVFSMPPGVGERTIDLERYGANPRRKHGLVTLRDVSSLVAYTHRHTTSKTTVWVDDSTNQIVSILNDHDTGEPGFGDHQAVLKLVPTPEWLHWSRRDGDLSDQVAFAEHIEDGLLDIAEPEPTILLDVAQTFHAKTDVNFRSANRLTDGQVQVQYDEEVQATAGRGGQLEIPREFTLAIAPFVGEPMYRVTARLRYRIGGGKLSIGYKLDRPHVVIRDAITKIVERLTDEFPGVVYLGTPR